MTGTEGRGDGGTSDDDRQPDDTGATGTLGDHAGGFDPPVEGQGSGTDEVRGPTAEHHPRRGRKRTTPRRGRAG